MTKSHSGELGANCVAIPITVAFLESLHFSRTVSIDSRKSPQITPKELEKS